MSSKTPTIKQVNWLSLLPHLIVMSLIYLAWSKFTHQEAVIYMAATYLTLSYFLRTQIPKFHREGIKLVKKEDFEEAIPYFEKSYEFFEKHKWVDKYRFITLLSSSRMTYQEMALANIGFCYGQLGNGEKSKEYYTRTLKEFPENGLAKASLKMLNSMNKES